MKVLFFILLFFCSALVSAQSQKAIELSMKLDGKYVSNGFFDPSKPISVPKNTLQKSKSQFSQNPLPLLREQSDSGANTTIGATRVHSGGWHFLSLSGNGQTIGIWDAGKPRLTHQEFGSRVVKSDTASVVNDNSHATQVMGAALASGVDALAKSAAISSSGNAYDWNNDASEMAYAAGNGLKISMHPYAETAGWVYNLLGGNKWVWYADTTYSSTENFAFGFYGDQASDWDDIAAAAPNYLIVKAAGNLRGRGPVTQPVQHWIPYLDGETWLWKLTTVSRDLNGGASGYETLSHASVSKNVLVVGSVAKIASGYSVPADVVAASDSGFGPTDDGRIKPDLAVPGISIYSPLSSSNSSYASSSGTSYSAGVAAGAVAVLAEHYVSKTSETPSSAMLKALLIHSANEAGADSGPDYKFGWGLLNLDGAIRLVSAKSKSSGLVYLADSSISQGQTLTISGTTWGESPLKVTVVWTDPAHAPLTASLNPTTNILVNDLDVRVNDGSTRYPWKLDRSSPANAATRAGDNATDNVEQILVDNPGSTYTVTITHKGTLEGGNQAFAILISSGNPMAESKMTGVAGWRMLSWPVESSWSMISTQLPIQGITGAPGGLSFGANVFHSYSGSAWSSPANISANPTAGSGFIQYVYNNANNGSRALPAPVFASGVPRASNIVVSLHASGDKFNLVGNPFDAAIDFSQVSANGSIQADGHVWDAALGWRLTSEIDDSIGVFQGFMIENNDATELTIPVSSRISGGRLRKRTQKTGFRIKIIHPALHPNPDNGFSVEFLADATVGYDRYESKKLWPFTTGYAGLGGRQDQETYARISYPLTLNQTIDIPVILQTSSATGTVSVVMESLGSLPEGFSYSWIDPSSAKEQILSDRISVSEVLPVAKAPHNPLAFSKTSSTEVWRVLRMIPPVSTNAEKTLPMDFGITGITPNPFNPNTRIWISLQKDGFADLSVFDLTGRRIQTLLYGYQTMGNQSLLFEGSRVPTGLYLLVLTTESGKDVRKITLVK